MSGANPRLDLDGPLLGFLALGNKANIARGAANGGEELFGDLLACGSKFRSRDPDIAWAERDVIEPLLRQRASRVRW